MALNWNIGSIRDHETLCFVGEGDKRKMRGTTETLIYATMFLGMNGITEKNWQEFYFRMSFYERLNGGLRRKWDGEGSEEVVFTADEIKAHIGLGTNATNETSARWKKRMVELWARDWKSRLIRETTTKTEVAWLPNRSA